MSAAKPHLQSVLQHPAIWRAADALRATECRNQNKDGLSTGYPALDRALPDGGWPGDGVAELLCPHWGCGETELMTPLLKQQSTQSRWLVWINPPWIPYAPALAQQGIVLENTLILRCRQDKEVLWAMEQCLASGSCSVVLGWPGNPQPQQIRRLQLAAQKGHGLGILLRPARFAQQPSPAPLRLELGPLQQQLQVRILKCRGHWGTGWLSLKPVTPALKPLEPRLPMGVASLTAEAMPVPAMPLHSTPALTPTTGPSLLVSPSGPPTSGG